MKIIEKPLSGKNNWLNRKAFIDVAPEFEPRIKGIRVLPVQYADTPNVFFELRNRWEPGQHVLFPDGGFEIVDVNGGVHNLFLDQLIVHPQSLGMRNLNFKETDEVKPVKIKAPTSGKRGRRPLDPEVKAQREADKAAKVTGGKRGRRPMDPELKALKLAEIAKRKGGKRGRRPMDPELKAQREAIKAKKTGGKRGRPSKKK